MLNKGDSLHIKVKVLTTVFDHNVFSFTSIKGIGSLEERSIKLRFIKAVKYGTLLFFLTFGINYVKPISMKYLNSTYLFNIDQLLKYIGLFLGIVWIIYFFILWASIVSISIKYSNIYIKKMMQKFACNTILKFKLFLIIIQINIARFCLYLNRYKQADFIRENALAMWKKAEKPGFFVTAYSFYNLAYAYNRQSKYKQAEILYKHALEIWEKGGNPLGRTLVLDSLAWLYADQDQYEQVESYYKRILEIWGKEENSKGRNTADSLIKLASFYVDQGKYEDAEKHYRQALAIREEVLGPEHPDTATCLNELARLYTHQDKYEEAEKHYRQALAIRTGIKGSRHRDIVTTYWSMAWFYEKQDKYKDAEEYYLKTLAFWERVAKPKNKPRHAYLAGILNDVAAFYVRQHKYEQAEECYLRALAIREKMHWLNQVVTNLNILASLYADQGKYEALPASLGDPRGKRRTRTRRYCGLPF